MQAAMNGAVEPNLGEVIRELSQLVASLDRISDPFERQATLKKFRYLLSEADDIIEGEVWVD